MMAQFIQTHHVEKALLYEIYKYLKVCDGKDHTFGDMRDTEASVQQKWSATHETIVTSHFVCVQSFHMVNIDVPAGVGAPPLDTHHN